MVMMFVGGVVLMFDGFLILFLLYNIYWAGVFRSRPNPNKGEAVNRNTIIRVRAGTENSRPVGFLL